MSTKTVGTVSDLMKQIDEIAARNKQAIDRINAKLNENALSYSYVVTNTIDTTTQNQKFHVEQHPKNISLRSICDRWQNTENNLLIIPDIFNDRINFNCSTFYDISLLNTNMLPVVHKYELFGETEKALEEVKKFYENFKQLEKFLNELEKLVSEKEESQLPQLNERFDNINNELNDVKTKFNDQIRFEFKFPPRLVICQFCYRQSMA